MSEMHTAQPWEQERSAREAAGWSLVVYDKGGQHAAWARQHGCAMLDAFDSLLESAQALLAACEAALLYLPARDGYATGEPDGEAQLIVCNRLRAAIAKAKGK